MPTNLRLTLSMALSLLLTLLVIGSAVSFRLVFNLQEQFAQLASAEHAAIEHDLLLGTLNQATVGTPGAGATLNNFVAALRAQPADLTAAALVTALENFQQAPDPATAQAEVISAAERYRDAQISRTDSLNAALAPMQMAGLYSLGALLISSGVVVLTSLLFSRGFRDPLAQLSAALGAVGSGNLTLRPPQRAPTEFTPLIHAYQHMVHALSERQQALDEQLRRTGILTRLSIELRETLDPAIIAARVLHAAGADLGGDEALLILLDAAGAPQRGYHWRQGGIQIADLSAIQRRSEAGVEGWAWRTGRSVQIDNVATHTLWQTGGGAPTGSAMVLPIRHHGVSLGSLSLVAQQTQRFTSRDLSLLEGIAAQASVALSAAQRYQEERERRKQAMALLSTSQFLTGERSTTELAALFAEQCRAIFGAAEAWLYLLDRTSTTPTAIGNPHGTVDPVLRSLADATAATTCNERQIVIQHAAAHTCLALPLIYAGQLLGAGVIVRPIGQNANLSANLWSLLTIFTGLIATASANIRLVERLREQASILVDQVEQRTEELRHSRDLLRIVFDNLPEGLLLMNADGALLAANNAFCRSIAGRRPQEIVGTSYVELWSTLAHQSDLRLEPQRPSEGTTPSLIPLPGVPIATTAATWRVLGTDFVGQQRWYAVERTPISRSGASGEQFLERWRDITLQEELQRRMLLHEQLTSLGRLAASVAHEVGNPLQSAMSCLELCAEEDSLSERSHEYLSLALGELERMGRTLESLRNLYRPPQTVWEQVHLNLIAQQVTQFTERQFQHSRISVNLTLDPTLPLVWGQPDALRQVLLNLLLNAQEAMPQGGTIELTTRRKTTDRVCELSIHDTGIGMTPEQSAHVFEPFHSHKAQGVGLGLALSRQITEQHTGHIGLTSAIGKGTTITLHLPWIDDAPLREGHADATL